MAELYLLPCECGQTLRVGRAQAGQEVACQCGKTRRVPTLRGLRDLEPAPDDTAETAPRRWTRWHGALFAGGLTVALIAAALAGLRMWQYADAMNYTQDQSSELLAYESVHIDEHPPAELYDLWNMIRSQGLGERMTPPWVQAQQMADSYRRQGTVAGVVALLAIIAAGASLFVGRGGA